MDKARAKIEKVGVGWIREFRNKKMGLKLSINKQIYIAFENTKKGDNPKAPNYVIVKFIDEPDEKKAEVKKEQV